MPVIHPAPENQGGLTEAEAGLVGGTVTQASHGFAVDDIVYNNDGTWAKAQADSAANAGASDQMAIVSSVPNANDFVPRFGGKHTSAGHGFTEGDILYLDAGTAGGLTATSPSTAGQVVVPCVEVLDDNTFLVKFGSGYTVE